MTQEQRELLLKDLCGRLLYGVKFRYKYINNFYREAYTTDRLKGILPPSCIIHSTLVGDGYLKIEEAEVKPYLFPLSSITEKQYDEFIRISGWNIDIETVRQGKFSCIGYIGLDCLYDAVDWFNKNHFDYRGLIPMNLAINATNLNIY
jgi:hypothetical protein